MFSRDIAQQRWDESTKELLLINAQFVEIHARPKEEVAQLEPKLKLLRKRCVQLAMERYHLADELRP